MFRNTLILTGFAIITVGCSTISEESCISESWESLGYEDGRDGKSRGHFSKIAETCQKYGISANATEYRVGYDQGLPLYCSYDKGLDHGENGSSFKKECREIQSIDYLDGYEEGRVVYEIRQEYESLIDVYQDTKDALLRVNEKISEDELSDKDLERLRQKRRRIELELDDARIDIRAFERIQGWPKKDLSDI